MDTVTSGNLDDYKKEFDKCMKHKTINNFQSGWFCIALCLGDCISLNPSCCGSRGGKYCCTCILPIALPQAFNWASWGQNARLGSQAAFYK